jgi:hypothetical protein
MEAAFAAISPLGFGLDLMEHKVLMRMGGGARRRAVVLARGRPEVEIGWKRTHEVKAVARLRESYGGGSESDGKKKKCEWGQHRPRTLYLYWGPLVLPVAVPSAVQHASMTLFREVREKIAADSSPTEQSHDKLTTNYGKQV